MTRSKNPLLATLLCTALSACGGGSSNDSGTDEVTNKCSSNNIQKNNDKYSIDNYMSMKCENSDNLNGAWLVTSTWDDRTESSGVIFHDRGQSRGIVHVTEISATEVITRNCIGNTDPSSEQEDPWTIEGSTWTTGLKHNGFPYATRTVTRHSNDHMTTSDEMGDFSFTSFFESTRKVEMEWIKVAKEINTRHFGTYEIDLEHNDQVIMDNETLSITCFNEVDSESMVDATNGFVGEGLSTLPESYDWTPIKNLRLLMDVNDAMIPEYTSFGFDVPIDAASEVNTSFLQQEATTSYSAAGNAAYTSNVEAITVDFVGSSEKTTASASALIEFK